ncbi:hypothetical protein [Agromyces sp. NPDC055661]
MKRVEVVDASILINVVDIPNEANDRNDVLAGLEQRRTDGISLVLPIAAVIETSQHVQRIASGHHRRRCAQLLDECIDQTIRDELPWTFIPANWDQDFVREFFAQTQPCVANFVDNLATETLEAGDMLLITEYRRLRASLNRKTHVVDVWTLDGGLRAAIDCLLGP